MSSKKTISNWLSSEYLLIIRSKDNFAEKQTFSFTYAKIIVFIVLAFLVFMGSSLYLANTILAKWLDPQYSQQLMYNDIQSLRYSLDSLKTIQNNNNQQSKIIKSILNGVDPGEITNTSNSLPDNINSLNKEIDLKIDPIDSAFRVEMLQTEASTSNNSAKKAVEKAMNMVFFPPTRIMSVSSPYDESSKHLGVDLISAKKEPVKTVADGAVIYSDEGVNGGYVIMVQHADEFISVYKHNSALLKSVGDIVKAGDVISIIGNTGHQSTGPHLHFELWYRGSPVDPAEFLGL